MVENHLKTIFFEHTTAHSTAAPTGRCHRRRREHNTAHSTAAPTGRRHRRRRRADTQHTAHHSTTLWLPSLVNTAHSTAAPTGRRHRRWRRAQHTAQRHPPVVVVVTAHSAAQHIGTHRASSLSWTSTAHSTAPHKAAPFGRRRWCHITSAQLTVAPNKTIIHFWEYTTTA